MKVHVLCAVYRVVKRHVKRLCSHDLDRLCSHDQDTYEKKTEEFVTIYRVLEFKRMSGFTDQYITRAKRVAEVQYASIRSALASPVSRSKQKLYIHTLSHVCLLQTLVKTRRVHRYWCSSP